MISFVPEAWEQYLYWQTQDKRTLKENLSGYWSRRIDDTHRLVYAVSDDSITVIACRFHYDD